MTCAHKLCSSFLQCEPALSLSPRQARDLPPSVYVIDVIKIVTRSDDASLMFARTLLFAALALPSVLGQNGTSGEVEGMKRTCGWPTLW